MLLFRFKSKTNSAQDKQSWNINLQKVIRETRSFEIHCRVAEDGTKIMCEKC